MRACVTGDNCFEMKLKSACPIAFKEPTMKTLLMILRLTANSYT